MVLGAIRKHVRIEDLIFSSLNDPELDRFLRQELEKLWDMTDWQLAKNEICSRIDELLSKGDVNKIAWHGENTQAKEILYDIVNIYENEEIEWFWMVEDLNLIDDQLPIRKILLGDWKSDNFNLTVNVTRDCPALFSSLQEFNRKTFLSPFSSEQCLSRAWDVNLVNAEKFIEEIHKNLKKHKVLVFIALRHGYCPSIEYIAKELSQCSGIKVYGIYLESDGPDNVYENIFTCNYSLGLLAELLHRLPPVTVYLQAHASWAYLGQFVGAVNNELRVIQEVYDWMGAFIGDEALFSQEGVFCPKQISLMRQSEDYICNHSDGYIYKDDGPWMKDKVRKSSSPFLKIYPCPPASYLKKPVQPEDDNVIKLVYAGQVSHERSSKKVFGDMYYIPVIRDLTEQGFHVTVYNAVHHSRRHPAELYREYLDEVKNSKLFEFKKGVSMPGILNELHGNYHFGLLAYYFEDDLHVGKDHLKGTMASKLFTYLAAGIPVIVSEQFEYMARIVKDEGLGVVVSRDDMKNLMSILKAMDYQILLSNILSAQKKYSICSQIPALKKVLNV